MKLLSKNRGQELVRDARVGRVSYPPFRVSYPELPGLIVRVFENDRPSTSEAPGRIPGAAGEDTRPTRGKPVPQSTTVGEIHGQDMNP